MTQLHSMDELTRQSGTHLDEVRQRLHERYQNVPTDRIRRYCQVEADRLAQRPIQVFVPILVERAVRDRLDHEALRGVSESDNA